MADEIKGIKAFLQKDTAGLPNWVWGLVVVAGIAVSYIVPKFLGKKSSSSSSSSAQPAATTGSGLGLAIDPTTGLPYAVEGLVPSGAGAGGGGSSGGGAATSGAGGTSASGTSASGTTTTGTTGSGTPPPDNDGGAKQTNWPGAPPGTKPGQTYTADTGTTAVIPVGLQQVDPTNVNAFIQAFSNAYPTNQSGSPQGGQFLTAPSWPQSATPLAQIASQRGVSVQRLQDLNPHLTGTSMVQAGQKIRIA